MLLKKLLLLFLSATLTLGFTACSDDDDDYPTLAQRNADKIRSLGIKTAFVHFPDRYTLPDDSYIVSIEGDMLVLDDGDGIKVYVPLDGISAIMVTENSCHIYIF